MFENTAIQIATSKLASVSLLPGSLFLMSGIVVWQLWRKQVKLQAETSELSKEFKAFKKQVTDGNKVDAESVASISSSDKSSSPAKDTSPEKMGLFEYLINDNIQIRK